MTSASDNISLREFHSLNPRPQKLIVTIALGVLVGAAVLLYKYSWRQSVLFIIGSLLGIALYNSSFGFASAYRKLLLSKDGRGMYGQLLMLSVATLLFAPLLSAGKVFGQEIEGAIAPIGISGIIGAFIFGIGMQLGGACGCGTLYTIGSGSYTMIITLITFCLGAFYATLTHGFWSGLPKIPPIVLGETIGWAPAVLIQLTILLLLAVGLGIWIKNSNSIAQNTQFSPWSIFTGAIALAVLNWLTLLISGHPWRITWGFALWTAKVAMYLGWSPSSGGFWDGDSSLSSSVFSDISSVMNLGIILGALLAAALAGKLTPQIQITPSKTLAKVTGGLLMGYGAFLSFGCNIGAFFSGIASTSLHGWIWIIFALLGTFVSIKLQALFDSPLDLPPMV
ncbi:YeeE/YedE family protein [Cylindrospermopsis raciborskii]|uniref:YeeE/YedE family protein n=1 Tax=Cylindrospermopsis raciborskii TaxID=77022 RepID=UPI0001C1681A|nr:YeeE/YedE family protein [Cylindrospermopsis raciborskii]EFA72209.1 YeeE/YedE [Raphidiopsis brookii D9]NLQ04768.1 YeeE/YedE family protein [Cylindrospermopsis raciborskii MVCC19]OHY33665.1 YeeE/YedE [Cylindrospermopsis raciborskii MVCC14]